MGHDLSHPYAHLSHREHRRLHFGTASTEQRGRIKQESRRSFLARLLMTILRWLEFLALSSWLGGDIFLSAVVAPGAFSVLVSRNEAGAIVGYSLTRLHWMGAICGVLILLFRLLRTRNFPIVSSPASLCILLMILLTMVSQLAVSPQMASLRVQMGSIQAAVADSTLVAEFSRLHRISVSLESAVLLAGFAALYLFVRETST